MTEDEIFNILFPEQFYDGPGAYTASELAEQSGFSIATVRRRIEEKMQASELVEVLIRRDGNPYRAWVAKMVYDKNSEQRR
ncbi:MAG: hypothetical protein ACYTDW_15145 [Planctomycetota bacterium]